MGGMFSSPKKPKIPKPVIPAPPAISGDGSGEQDFVAKNVARKAGYKKTILTGALTPKSSGKKKRLG